MSTEQGLADLYTVQFSSNLNMLLQQMESVLMSTVRQGTHVGKMASPINQIGPVKTRRPSGRFTPLDPIQPNYVRRWVFPVDGDLPQLIDSFDELKTIVNPQSEFVQNATAAVGRDYDDAIIAGATGTAVIGVDPSGLTNETFDTTNHRVAVTFGSTAASGMIVPKLIETQRIFRKYHVDIEREPPTLVIGSQQHADLLNQAQVVSTDFNPQAVLVEGRVTRFLGFNIKHSERLPIVSSNVRGCLAYVKSGIYLGKWKEMVNRASIRTDLTGHPWQLYTMYSFGVTRVEAGRVIQILCADTTGADITP